MTAWAKYVNSAVVFWMNVNILLVDFAQGLVNRSGPSSSIPPKPKSSLLLQYILIWTLHKIRIHLYAFSELTAYHLILSQGKLKAKIKMNDLILRVLFHCFKFYISLILTYLRLWMAMYINRLMRIIHFSYISSLQEVILSSKHYLQNKLDGKGVF